MSSNWHGGSSRGNRGSHDRPGTSGSSGGNRGSNERHGPNRANWKPGDQPGANWSNRSDRRPEDQFYTNWSGGDSDRSEDRPGTSSGSSNRSKRPREPSPEPSTSAAPSIRINTSIFESDPNEEESQHSYSEDKKDMRDVKRKIETGDPEITEDMQNLGNFFTFTDPSKTLPSIAPQRNVGEAGAPVPKLPRVAHYNAHNPDEEVQYVEEGRRLYDQAIPDHQTDTDESDEEIPAPLRNRIYHLRDAVFEKYDFQTRSIDATKLMAYEHKDRIINAIEGNRVVIIDGFTGCGKTTQVPQLIIDRAAELRRPCNVIVTQPRKLAAVSVARRVCEERHWELGTVVGYQVGMDRRVCPDTLVTYMTTGVLLQKLIRCRSLKNWTHIIVDEVHERDLHTDLLLLFIKKILIEDKLGKERHVKLILMSATVNSRQFSKYFAVSKCDDESVETPVIKIPTTKRFKIEDFFLDQLVSSTTELDEIYARIDMDRAALIPEMYTQAVRTIKDLDRQESSHDPRLRQGGEDKMIQRERGSVLVFLPGIMEIKTMVKLLNEENRRKAEETKCNDSNPFKWEIVPLHSSITNDEQRKVFEPPKPYRRKIILSTNIAESSITVPDIVYVIDFCLTKSNCVDARTNFSCLRICWASVSQCIQRAGRSGRVRDGKVYRMIPKRTYAQLDQDATPDMLKSALEYVVLQVKVLDMGSPKDILCLALDPPEISGIERAVSNLKEVGAMTVMTTVNNQLMYSTCDGDVTYMGQIMTVLPISPQCARLIMLGHCFGVMKEAIIIAAGLSGKSPFSHHFSKQLDSYLQKMNWAKKSYSDCLAILHAYRAWYKQFAETDEYLGVGRRSNFERDWARTQSIQLSQMREIRNMVEEIEQRLRDQELLQYQFPVEYSIETENLPKEIALMLKIAIAGAFYPNYFHRQRPYDLANYERDRSKEVNGNDLFSTVYYKGFPYGHKGKLYAKHVADFLSHGLSVPYVKFEGQKVLAIFDSTGKKIGPICIGVYRAIKKRQIQENLEFKLLWKEEEDEELRRYDEHVQKRHFIRCPPQIALPGIDRNKIDVFITHVESPSQFYIVYGHMYVKHTEMFERINGNITKNRVKPHKACVGALVLAPFQDEGETCYYRGRILTPLDGLNYCLIYFIDYGNSERVSVNVLLELPPELIQQDYNHIPGLAIECRLCLLKPAIVHGSVWAEAAIEKFKAITNSAKYFEFRIHAVDKSVISGELFSIPESHSDTVALSVNKWLLEGFADTAPEPYTANLNFKTRGRFHLMRHDKEQIEGCNRQQIAESIDRDFIPPPMHGSIPCTLKGPHSPLELNFQSVCQSSNAKQVTVDGHSVNSVSLDHEPTAPTARLLVASSITIQEKSGKVVARETTMMPATPGMLALMSLIFAPRAELRCDPRMTRYTGALCGLGTDNLNEPIYMDHDMEIVFDTEIDDDDIDRINKIRYLMNVVLRKSQGQNNAPVHTNLCKDIIRLLKKSRRRVDEEVYPQESYVWNRIPPSHVISADRSHYEILPLDIFLPHNKIRLTHEDLTIESFDFAV